jgi:hypothetical protein
MLKPRVSAFLSLLFVFLSGILVGTLGYRWYSVNNNPRRPEPAEVRRHIIAEMTQSLNLDATQVEQVSKILDETRTKFDGVHKEMNGKAHEIWQEQIEEINQVLRSDQRPLYAQLREKHEKEREERKKQHQRGIQQDTGKK